VAEEGEVVFDIRKGLPEEEEALRLLQAVAIRRFLERVCDNRNRLGMSPSRGNLGATESQPLEVVNE
jgi:hypothetical protein